MQATTTPLTRTLARMQIRLWKNSLSSNKQAVFFVVIIFLYGLIGCVFLAAQVPNNGLHLASAILALGLALFALINLGTPNQEQQLSPDMFVTLPIHARRFSTPLLAISALNSRGVLVAINSIIMAVAGCVAATHYDGPRSFAIMILWVIAVAFTALLTIFLGEVLSLLTKLGQSKKHSVLTQILSTLIFIALFGVYLWVVNNGVSAATAARLGSILEWTPLAAPAGVAIAVAEGQWLGVLLKLAMSAITLFILVRIHRSLVGKLLSMPITPAQSTKVRSSGALRVPLIGGGTPKMAILARMLLYLRRDNRYRAFTLFPVMGITMMVLGLFMDKGNSLPTTGFLMIATAGALSSQNFLGMDGPNAWVDISSHVKAKDRILAQYAFGLILSLLPFMLVALVALATQFLGDSTSTFVFLGLTIAISSPSLILPLAVALAFKAAPAGTNTFKDRSGAQGSAFISSMILMFVAFMVPGIIYGLVSAFHPAVIWVILPLIAYTAIVTPLGIFVAIRMLQKRWLRIFSKTNSWLS